MDKLTVAGFGADEIEQAALGCLMNDPKKSWVMIESRGIKIEHFQTPANRVLYGSLQHYWKEGHSYDLIPFTEELRRLGLLDTIGGAFYVTQTWVHPKCLWSTAEMLDYYLDLLEESFAKKMLYSTCQQGIEDATALAVEGEEAVTQTIEELGLIPLPSRHRHEEKTLAEIIEEVVTGDNKANILETGLVDLDYKSPLYKGDMPLIAGTRKSGKTMLALSITLNLLRRALPVLYFSLEDERAKIVGRLVDGIARSRTDKPLRDSAGQELALLPFHLTERHRDLTDICAYTRQMFAQHEIALCFIDYAQLVRVETDKDVNREQIVAEVSRTFRLLAMELHLPIVLLSQLNAEGFTRESRALENDCTAMWRLDPPKDADEPNIRSIVIPFQRNGESGIAFKVTFLGDIGRIENYSP